jgi:hypothetical protein
MRRIRLAAAFVASTALALTLGSISTAAQSGAQDKVTPAPAQSIAAPSAKVEGATPAVRFGILAGVTATPMASGELDAVKGLHVHFLDAGGGKVHLAGDIKTENNWQNLGGSDGNPVAPSYHGLCVAIGTGGPGGIVIPGSAVQC